MVFLAALLAAQPSLDAAPGPRRPLHRLVIARTQPKNGVKRVPGKTDEFLRELTQASAWVGEVSLRPSKDNANKARLRLRMFDGDATNTWDGNLELENYGDHQGSGHALLVVGPHISLTQKSFQALGREGHEQVAVQWAKTLGGVLVMAKFAVNDGPKPQTWLEIRSPNPYGTDPRGTDIFFATADEKREQRSSFNDGHQKVFLKAGETGHTEIQIAPADPTEVVSFYGFVDEN